MLVSLSKETINLDHFKYLTDNNIPVVFYDKISRQQGTYNISFNNKLAVENAVNQLVSGGNRPKRFVGFFGDERLSISYSGERLEAFKQCMKKNGYTEADYDLVFADSVAEAAEKSKALFSQNNPPDACIAMGDDRLLGISKSVQQLGIKVPEHLAMIALSDGFIPTALPFNIPYILTSGYEMGKIAASLLFDLIADKDVSPNTAYVDTPIVNI